MTTTNELRDLIDSTMGGDEPRTRHPFNRRFIYTAGVKAVAELVGAYWLLDIIATEIAPISIAKWDEDENSILFFRMTVSDSKAKLWLERDTDDTVYWTRDIEFTDFPAGEWTFYLEIDGLIVPDQIVVVMLLPTEH